VGAYPTHYHEDRTHICLSKATPANDRLSGLRSNEFASWLNLEQFPARNAHLSFGDSILPKTADAGAHQLKRAGRQELQDFTPVVAYDAVEF